MDEKELEERVEKLTNDLPLYLGAQLLIYAIILTGIYFYAKKELDRVNQPFVDAAVQLQAQINEVNDYLRESNRQFQEEYEKRRQERMRLLHDQGQQMLDTLEANFRRYEEQSSGYFERLRQMEAQMPALQQRSNGLEDRQKQLEKEVQNIGPSQ